MSGAGGASGVRVEAVSGAAIGGVLAAVARLRIAVFREWPYLYDGTLDYEQRYLAEFAKAPDAVIVAAYDGEAIVGAATAAPLAGHTAEFIPLFAAAGFDPATVFYCGESVLLPSHRGRGLGHAFFDAREAQARACTSAKGAYRHTAFCGVVRDADDARRPVDYVALDTFWRRRGYAPVEGLVGTYDWKEIGAVVETRHAMQFWIKAL